MDVREKLVELIQGNTAGFVNPYAYEYSENAEQFADYLIANGVTVQDNTEISEELLQQLRNSPITILQDEPTIEVVQEWISVSEPPKENGYYLCYVLTSAVGDKVKYEQMPLYWEDDIWLYRHNSYRMCRNVTHWMPLPKPPKGE